MVQGAQKWALLPPIFARLSYTISMAILSRLEVTVSKRYPRLYAFSLAHITSIAFVLGFVWDNLTLTSIDSFYDNIVLFSYLLIASGSIFLINIASTGRVTRMSRWLAPLAQFAFGGLFSSYIVYFSRTGVWFSSWPFLLALVGLVIGNEVFKSRYQSFIFQTGVWFVAVFLFLIFYLPVITGAMGTVMFAISGIIALVLTGLYIYVVYRAVPVRVMYALKPLLGIIAGAYLILNALYFFNIIPPLPHSLTFLSASHSVSDPADGNYQVTFEPLQHGWRRLIPFMGARETVHLTAAEPVYVMSSVFAPARLQTPIYHRYEWYNTTRDEWQFMGRVGFPIAGGRDEGYRGYSYKDAPLAGRWRVSVETERGAIIGRISFRIEEVEAPVSLQSELR